MHQQGDTLARLQLVGRDRPIMDLALWQRDHALAGLVRFVGGPAAYKAGKV